MHGIGGVKKTSTITNENEVVYASNGFISDRSRLVSDSIKITDF